MDMFRTLDTVLFLRRRRAAATTVRGTNAPLPTFEAVRGDVEEACGRSFTLRHVAQMLGVWPGAYRVSVRRVTEDDTALDGPALPSGTAASAAAAASRAGEARSSAGGTATAASRAHDVANAHHNSRGAWRMVIELPAAAAGDGALATRRAEFQAALLAVADAAHREFLQLLQDEDEGGMRLSGAAVVPRWHPDFSVEDVPLPEAQLPQPPVLQQAQPSLAQLAAGAAVVDGAALAALASARAAGADDVDFDAAAASSSSAAGRPRAAATQRAEESHPGGARAAAAALADASDVRAMQADPELAGLPPALLAKIRRREKEVAAAAAAASAALTAAGSAPSSQASDGGVPVASGRPGGFAGRAGGTAAPLPQPRDGKSRAALFDLVLGQFLCPPRKTTLPITDLAARVAAASPAARNAADVRAALDDLVAAAPEWASVKTLSMGSIFRVNWGVDTTALRARLASGQ
jgi:hypothetical protein